MVAMKIWLRMVVACCVLAPPFAQAADSIILTADHWCPHTCDATDGRDGYMVDIAREALALSGLKTVYQVRPWSTAVKEVRAGLADGIVGVLDRELPDLPHNRQPLGRQINALVVRAADKVQLPSLDSLAGRRVAIVQSYSYSPDIDAWLAAHAAQISPQSGNRAAEINLERLLADRVDVVLDDEAVLRDAIIRAGLTGKVRIAGRLGGGTLHLAFSPSRQAERSLPRLLDEGIAHLRQSGRLAEILAGYGLADWQ